MKLIIGLGNPGSRYKNTRHNVGFRVLDELANTQNLKFRSKKTLLAESAEFRSPLKEKILLAKPLTFMNESGEAVLALKNFYKIQSEQILIIHDEIDLPFGTIRLSQNAGSAGHRGVESVIEAIGQNFLRLRIGIENRKLGQAPDTEIYVLQNFTKEEQNQLKKKILPDSIIKLKSSLLNFAKQK